MQTVPINSPLRLELGAILEGISQLDTESLENFALQVNQLLAHRKAPHLTDEETSLIREINTGIAPDRLARYHQLMATQKTSELSPAQEQELIALADEMESQDVRRMEQLIALAALWNMRVPAVCERLGISTPDPHVW